MAAPALRAMPGRPCLLVEDLPQTPQADRWLAEDKLMHFFMSYATTGLAYAAARTAGVHPDAALAGGVAAGVVAGLGKELYDRRGGGVFSFKDLVWDVLGVGVGVLVTANVR